MTRAASRRRVLGNQFSIQKIIEIGTFGQQARTSRSEEFVEEREKVMVRLERSRRSNVGAPFREGTTQW